MSSQNQSSTTSQSTSNGLQITIIATSVVGAIVVVITVTYVFKWWRGRRQAAAAAARSEPEKAILPPSVWSTNDRRWSDMSETQHPLLMPTSPTTPWSARASRVFSLPSSRRESVVAPQPVTRTSTRSSFFPPQVPPSPPPNTHASHTIESIYEEPIDDPELNPIPPLPSKPLLPSIRHEASIELFHPTSLTPAGGRSRQQSRAPSRNPSSRAPSRNASSRTPSRTSSTSSTTFKRDKSRKPKELRAALLTRIASNRAKKYGRVGDDDAPPSPSSVYSQASAGGTIWANFEGGTPEEEIPPMLLLPEGLGTYSRTLTRSPSVATVKSYNPFVSPSSDPEDREVSRFEESFAYSVPQVSLDRDVAWVSNAIRGIIPTSPDIGPFSPIEQPLLGRRAGPALPPPVVQNTSGYQEMPQFGEVEHGLSSATGTLAFSVPMSRSSSGQVRPLPVLPLASKEALQRSRRDGLLMA